MDEFKVKTGFHVPEPEVDDDILGDLKEGDLDAVLAQAEDVPQLDASGLKKAVLGFEKAFNRNQELRIRYAGSPEKFMDSEIELDVELKKLGVLATAPELYPLFVKLKTLESVLAVVSHENADISIDAVDLLNELTEPDNFIENEKALCLVDSLVENNGLEILVENLLRLDERNSSEDAQAVHKTLGIMENLTEAKPEMATTICERTKLLRILLDRIQLREFSDNKLYASEILAICLQSSKLARAKIMELDGMEALLQSVAIFRKSETQNAEETEMLENLFDCFCTLLLDDASRNAFSQAQGVELMIIMLKSKSQSAQRSSLKVLDFAMQAHEKNCTAFVKGLGLSMLFGIFMGKYGEGKSKKRKRGTDSEKAASDEHACSILVSLLATLSPSSDEIARVVKKFTENDLEKIGRLCELHRKYFDTVQATDARMKARGLDKGDYTEEEVYLDRLDAGLFTLQLVDQIVAYTSTNDSVKERFAVLMRQNERSMSEVKGILNEYIDSLGEESLVGDAKIAAAEKKARMTSLCKNL